MDRDSTTGLSMPYLAFRGVAPEIPTPDSPVNDWGALLQQINDYLMAQIKLGNEALLSDEGTQDGAGNASRNDTRSDSLTDTPVPLSNLLDRFECEILYNQERLGAWGDCWQWRTGIFAQLIQTARQADLVGIAASLNNHLVILQLAVKQRRFTAVAPWLSQTRGDLVDLSDVFDSYPLTIPILTSPVLERNLLDAIQSINPWQTRLPEVAELIAQCLALHQKAIAIAQTEIMPAMPVAMDASLGISPLASQLVYNLGNIYAAIGQKDIARANYEQVLEWQKTSSLKDAQSAKAWFSLGNLALNLSERDKAQQYFTHAISADPYLLRARVNYAYTLEQLGDLAAAQNYLTECLADDTSLNGKDAVTDDSDLTSLMPATRKQAMLHQNTLSVAYHNLARIYQRQGDLLRATRADEQAITYQPTNLHAKFQLANSYRQAQKFFEAAAQYEAILQMDAYFVAAYLPLIDLYIIFGNSGINIYQKWCDLTEHYIAVCQEDFPDWVLSAQIKSLRANLMAGNAEIATGKLAAIEAQLFQNQMEQVNIPAPIWAELYAEFLFFVPFLRDDVAQNGKLFDLVGQNYAHYVAQPLITNLGRD